LKLAKAGYGSFLEVKSFDARTVLQMLHYETFCADYERAYMELNK